MKKDKSEIIIILDRSRSMQSIKEDMVGGFKTFLEKQKLDKGECYLSLFQFDDAFETVYEQQNIKNVNELVLAPRGGTALYDAIVKSVNKVGQRLAQTSEDERPESVIVLIITDGEENSSKEFTSEKVAEVIRHQTEKYNWNFIFLGANQDAILTAKTLGIAATNSLTYYTSSAGIQNTWQNVSTSATFSKINLRAYNFSDTERAASVEK